LIVSTVVAAARLRRIRARSDPESLISESGLKLLISQKFLISSESDLDEFVLVAVVSPSDDNDELTSLETKLICTCPIIK